MARYYARYRPRFGGPASKSVAQRPFDPSRERIVQLLTIDTPVEVHVGEHRSWSWPTPVEIGAAALSLIDASNETARAVVHYSLLQRPCRVAAAAPSVQMHSNERVAPL